MMALHQQGVVRYEDLRLGSAVEKHQQKSQSAIVLWYMEKAPPVCFPQVARRICHVPELISDLAARRDTARKMTRQRGNTARSQVPQRYQQQGTRNLGPRARSARGRNLQSGF